MNPNTVLHDEDAEGNLIPYHPQMTASQTYLWDFYTQAIEQVRKIAGKMPLYLLHLGDETDGVRYGDHKISNRLSDQVIIAIDVLRPWLEIKTLRLIRLVVGTAAHNFGEGSSTHLICAALRGAADIQPLYHGILKIGGVSIDYSHHGPSPNMRRWLSGNLARFYLRDLMMGALMRGENPPDLVLRGHVHVPAYEYLEEGRHK